MRLRIAYLEKTLFAHTIDTPAVGSQHSVGILSERLDNCKVSAVAVDLVENPAM